MKSRDSLHKQYDRVHRELLAQMDTGYFGDLETEEEILAAAVTITHKSRP